MTSIFQSSDYRTYLAEKIKTYPNGGFGVSAKLAAHIGVHPSLVSQILKGGKFFTPDQAIAAADFFGLSELESECLLLLVQLDRAATNRLKVHLGKKINRIRKDSGRIVNRIKSGKKISEEARGIFYSDWKFSAVRQVTAIPGFQTIEKLSERLSLSRRELRNILDFLVQNGLCVEKSGHYSPGTQITHLAETSPWAKVQHRNWRLQAMDRLGSLDPDSLFFTCPMTISRKDRSRVREKLVQFISDLYKIVEPSPSEELCCVNIDWFHMHEHKDGKASRN